MTLETGFMHFETKKQEKNIQNAENQNEKCKFPVDKGHGGRYNNPISRTADGYRIPPAAQQ